MDNFRNGYENVSLETNWIERSTSHTGDNKLLTDDDSSVLRSLAVNSEYNTIKSGKQLPIPSGHT